ncbi:MAG TPA: MFS transporter [Bacillota bacterium]|nr:MFS transporter [Bacillota bacterium]HPF42216.1 MFS transporter [Bacillota bacterium]HPQ61771.1 MFS transporter [Bacillota bacterium]
MKMSETFKFKLFYFIRYFGDAFFYPFMSIYFVSKGISDSDLGLIFAITPITTILVNPFWNYIVKDIKTSRLILKIMTVIEGAMIITMTQISGFEMYALIVSIIAFFCSPFINIQDGFTATFCNNEKIEYSSIRIYASIAYVVASAIAGSAILWFGYESVFIISGTFFILTSLIVFWLKPFKKDAEVSEDTKRDIKSLLKNKNFYKYLIYYTITIGAVRIGDSFFGVYITDLGLESQWYGLLYAAFVFVEVITLRIMITKGQSMGERKLLVLANFLFVARFIFYGFDLPLSVIIPVTLLRGASWGILIYANIHYIIKIVKVENVTTAILIITLFFSIFTAIGNYGFGLLADANGYSMPYQIVAATVAFGFVFFLAFSPKIPEETDKQ